MSIPKKGGYSGARPASEMCPPANLPSATIKPKPAFSEHAARPDWSLYLNAMRLVENRRALVADVDLPAEYAKAAASVTATLILDLAYAQADARHQLHRYESTEAELRAMRQAWADAECDRSEAVALHTLRCLDDRVCGKCRAELDALCFCGKRKDEHPPGPPCPPPPPPGVPHG